MSTEETPVVIVRLRTSRWGTRGRFYISQEFTVLRRQSKGFDFFSEDASMVGVDETLSKIINLSQCEDGIYQVIMVNVSRDWETGHVDDWDYQLVPVGEQSSMATEASQSPKPIVITPPENS